VPENVETIFTLIYNQQFSKADSILTNSSGEYDNFYHDILKLDLYYWEYSIESNRQKSDRLKSFLSEFHSKKESEIAYGLKELIFLSYTARYELKRYNIPGALLLRSKIKTLLTEINRHALEFPENRLKLFDLYNLLFQYFDNVFNPLFLETKRNERELALEKIKTYTNDSDLIVNTLANYFLGKIYLKIEKEPLKSKVHFEVLLNKYPDNRTLSELLEECEKKSGV
jgi:hypothetical protein